MKQQPDNDTLSFESNEKDIHTPLPADTGRISRSSMAFLYEAIVCTVISNQSFEERSVFESPSEDEKDVAKAICRVQAPLYR